MSIFRKFLTQLSCRVVTVQRSRIDYYGLGAIFGQEICVLLHGDGVRWHSIVFLKLFILVIFLHTTTQAFANRLSFSAGSDFTTGDYGGVTPTNIWYVPFTARYEKGRASFRIIVPYLDITGPGNVLGPGIGGIGGSGGIIGGGLANGGSAIVVCDEGTGCVASEQSPDGGNAGTRQDHGNEIKTITQEQTGQPGLTDGGIPLSGLSSFRASKSGLGDVIGAFSYNLIDHVPSGIAFDVTARLKIPTASASHNLGSGQFDYAIQGDLYKTVSQFTLVATFGYRILGNPAAIPFHNVFYGAATIGYRLSPSVSLGTSYTMAQSPVRLQDSRDLTVYFSRRITDDLRINLYGLRGFSERSPDWGGGINLRYIF